MHLEKLKELCDIVADILDGEGSVTEDGVCLIQRLRDLNFTIDRVPTRSPLVRPQFFSFEFRDGRVLNLGETVLLEEEINPLLTELRKRDITVTAIHNHWLFDEPRAMYMHFQSTDDDPIVFAKKVAAALKVLDRSDRRRRF
ncbi:DUF1259 domain-containing protein [Alteribacillus sp. JSM 102045]|uniref:DUF1259 domain-containing protein n=1 Tax=Alteribacillus sp. JSM 102045 TaxID=1562101 RepID=UPI0035C1BE85